MMVLTVVLRRLRGVARGGLKPTEGSDNCTLPRTALQRRSLPTLCRLRLLHCVRFHVEVYYYCCSENTNTILPCRSQEKCGFRKSNAKKVFQCVFSRGLNLCQKNLNKGASSAFSLKTQPLSGYKIDTPTIGVQKNQNSESLFHRCFADSHPSETEHTGPVSLPNPCSHRPPSLCSSRHPHSTRRPPHSAAAPLIKRRRRKCVDVTRHLASFRCPPAIL